MCGIAGIVWSDGTPASAEMAAAMGASIAHRGPDDAGVWIDGPVALAHQRLSIIDLSPRGHQPMVADGTAVLTYNGEIYNYRALRAELESRGHAFVSTSDTEVVLRAYVQWGEECLRRFVGMFAFGLWDARTRSLLVARDPLGIKPLFYAETPRCFAFGSEIKALLAAGVGPRVLDAEGFLDGLAFGAPIAPRTMIAGIRQLRPAHAAVVREGHVRMWRYWTPRADAHAERDDDAWLDGFRERFETAVAGCLQSDAPFGVLLSAGIDSNAVATVMARRLGPGTPSFTIGFGAPSFDESARASELARGYGLEPHVGDVDEAKLPDLLPRIVQHSEEPVGNPSFVATWHLAALASTRVKMALSGDGADELFAGYETYAATLVAERLQRVLPKRAIRALGAIADLVPGGFRKRSTRDSLRRFLHGAARPTLDRHGVWRAIVRRDDFDRLIADTGSRARAAAWDPVAESYGRALAETPFTSTLQRLLHADAAVYLPNDGLVKMDRMGMAHGLEVRVPFLNHDLVEYVFAMPDHLKMAGRERKVALRRVLRGRVADAVLDARKMGFNAPAAAWLRGPLRTFARDTLAPAAVRRDGLFEPETVGRLLDTLLRGWRDTSWTVWLILIVTLWHRTFLQGNAFSPTASHERLARVLSRGGRPDLLRAVP